jgi:hypothetical protein
VPQTRDHCGVSFIPSDRVTINQFVNCGHILGISLDSLRHRGQSAGSSDQ